MARSVSRKVSDPKRTSAPPRRKPVARPPAFASPQLCQLRETAPTGPDWVHEIKLDGYLDALDRHTRHRCKPDRGRAQALRISNVRSQRSRRADPSEAKPVILTTEEEQNAWLRAGWIDAQQLQQPLPNDALKIVATDDRED